MNTNLTFSNAQHRADLPQRVRWRSRAAGSSRERDFEFATTNTRSENNVMKNYAALRCVLAVICATGCGVHDDAVDSEVEESSEALKGKVAFPRDSTIRSTGIVPGRGSPNERSLGITQWRLEFVEGLSSNIWHYRLEGLTKDQAVVYDVKLTFEPRQDWRHGLSAEYLKRPGKIPDELALRRSAIASVKAAYVRLHRRAGGAVPNSAPSTELEDQPLETASQTPASNADFDSKAIDAAGSEGLATASNSDVAVGRGQIQPSFIPERCAPLPGINLGCMLSTIFIRLSCRGEPHEGPISCWASEVDIPCTRPFFQAMLSPACSPAPERDNIVIQFRCRVAAGGVYHVGLDIGNGIYQQRIPANGPVANLSRWSKVVCGFDGKTTGGCAGSGGYEYTDQNGTQQKPIFCYTPISTLSANPQVEVINWSRPSGRRFIPDDGPTVCNPNDGSGC